MILFLMSPAYWVIFYRSTHTIALYFPTPCLFRNSSAHVEDSRSLLFQLRPDIRKGSVLKVGCVGPRRFLTSFRGNFGVHRVIPTKGPVLGKLGSFRRGRSKSGKNTETQRKCLTFCIQFQSKSSEIEENHPALSILMSSTRFFFVVRMM